MAERPFHTTRQCVVPLVVALVAFCFAGSGSWAQQILDGCFPGSPRRVGDAQPGDGGYWLEVEFLSPSRYYVYAVGNRSFAGVLIQASGPGLRDAPRDIAADPLQLGPCPDSVTNGVALNSRRAGAVFKATSSNCTEFLMTVIRTSTAWYTNITEVICPSPGNVSFGCGEPPPSDNAVLVVSADDWAAYECRSGYTVSDATIGSLNISCMDDDQWENTTGLCRDIDECISDAARLRRCHTCHNIPGSFQCVCNASYELLGTVCLESCGNPGHHAMGSFEPANGPFVLNRELRYSCQEGYDLVGESVLSCDQASAGNTSLGWSHAVPACVPTVDTSSPSSSGLSSTTIAVIAVCSLAGVAIIVLLVVLAVVSHTRSMYKTLAKRQSMSSLQSSTARMVRSVSATSAETADGAYVNNSGEILDNRRRSRRNSRYERRSRKWSSESLAQAKEKEFHLTPMSGDISFSASLIEVEESMDDIEVFGEQAISSKSDGQLITDSLRNSLLAKDNAPSTDYAAIGPKGGLVQ